MLWEYLFVICPFCIKKIGKPFPNTNIVKKKVTITFLEDYFMVQFRIFQLQKLCKIWLKYMFLKYIKINVSLLIHIHRQK